MIRRVLERNRKALEELKRAMYYVVGVRKCGDWKKMGILGWIPKDVVWIIVNEVWKTRGNFDWVKE